MPKRDSQGGERGGEYETVALEGGGYKRRKVGAKKWSYMCEHDRQKSACKECGGSSVCEHGRRRSRCKECGGSSMCEHGRERHRCKECGGASICEHGRERSRCKDCERSSAPARRAPSHASEAGAADESGYETGTYADEGASNYVRPRNRRAVVKQEDASDDSGYDTATYEEGSSFVRPLGRPKVKEEDGSD